MSGSDPGTWDVPELIDSINKDVDVTPRRKPSRRRDISDERMTEDELALQFVELHPEHRWVERWHKWMRWNGTVWAEDSTLHVYDQVRQYLRNISWAAKNSDELRRAKLVSAVETLCRSDRRVAGTVD